MAIMLCFYLLGSLGAIGYLIYFDCWHIAIGVAATAYMAYPKAREYWNVLYY